MHLAETKRGREVGKLFMAERREEKERKGKRRRRRKEGRKEKREERGGNGERLQVCSDWRSLAWWLGGGALLTRNKAPYVSGWGRILIKFWLFGADCHRVPFGFLD